MCAVKCQPVLGCLDFLLPQRVLLPQTGHHFSSFWLSERVGDNHYTIKCYKINYTFIYSYILWLPFYNVSYFS